ncbi:MAG: hypothetical protein IBX50_14530 [Marinospirillum sp.]|uniref:hypothetical protein n=1 Tax=Marinospirillum sp. TaxID=2183934 RepID=UPI001A107BD9|nr:hypothetical protein [Marinospirillum sp.]MBE0507904.1 hypothetical protein [Marinospirillum sp.]
MAEPDIYNLSNDESVEEFQRILASKPEWAKLEDSQFIRNLAIFNSWQYRAAMWRLERDRQEAFLSTAVNRSSVLAGAEDKSYVPRMATPSKGKALLTSTHTTDVLVPSGSVWLMPDQTPLTIPGTAVVPANGSILVDVEQYEVRLEARTVSDAVPFYEVLIDKEITRDICGVAVFVDGNRWTYHPRLMNTTSVMRAYDLFYTSLDQLGIRFGDGFFGRIPPAGSIIQLELQLTRGSIEIAQGQQMSRVVANGSDPILAKVSAITSTIIQGGQPQEDIESIRLNARYYPLYDEQLVWRDDYKFQVERIWPEAVWVRVWGEQEQERVYGFDVTHINKIYISAWAPDNPTIGDEILDRLEEPLNRTYVFVPPAMQPFTITLTAVIPRTIQISNAENQIASTLLANYGRDSRNRKTEIKIKDFYSLIERTGVFADGGHFVVDIAGLVPDNGLNDLIYLDLDLSALDISYG